MLTSACAALTSEDLPMPRAPHSSALLAGNPSAKRRVFSSNWSEARSIPLRSAIGWRLTRATDIETVWFWNVNVLRGVL